MDNNSSGLIKNLPKFVLSVALVFFSGLSTFAEASSTPVLPSATTAPIELAYFRVYRVQPGWWYGSYPAPLYRYYAPVCQDKCFYKRHTTLRCPRTCCTKRVAIRQCL